MRFPISQLGYIVFILAVAAALRVYFFNHFPLVTIEGDAMCRFIQAYEFDYLEGSFLKPGALVWLPFHHFFLYLGMVAHPSYPLMGAKLITLVTGIITVVPLFLLTQKLFRNTTASFFAALLLALNPFQAKYSVITMTEVPFLFCVFCALYLLYLHLDTKKLLPLIFSSVFIGFASWIRFDGWLFAAGLTLMLFFYDANLRRTLLYGAMNFGPIAIYMLWAKLERGIFTYGIYMSDLEVFYSYQSNPRSYLRMFYEIRSDFAFSFSLAFIAVVSVWYCWRHKKHLPLQLLVAGLMAMVFYKWTNRTLESQGRYLSTPLFMLFPFMGYFLYKISSGSKLLLLLLSTAIVFIYIPQVKTTFNQVTQSITDPGFYESCNWIRQNKTPSTKYVMNVANFNYCGVNALAGIPTSRSYFPHYPGFKKYSYYEKFSHTVLLRLLTKDGYDHLFFQRMLEMDSIFHSPVFVEAALKHGLVFKEQYQKGEYYIYSVTKP